MRSIPCKPRCSSQAGHQQGLNFEFSLPCSIFDCWIGKQVVLYSCLAPEGTINLPLAARTAPFPSPCWGNGRRTWERGMGRTRNVPQLYTRERDARPGGGGERPSGLVQSSQSVGIWGWNLSPVFVRVRAVPSIQLLCREDSPPWCCSFLNGPVSTEVMAGLG